MLGMIMKATAASGQQPPPMLWSSFHPHETNSTSAPSGQQLASAGSSVAAEKGGEEEFCPLRGLPDHFRIHVNRWRILPFSDTESHSLKVVPCSSSGPDTAQLLDGCMKELTSAVKGHDVPIQVMEVTNEFACKSKSTTTPPFNVTVSCLPILHVLLLCLTPPQGKEKTTLTTSDAPPPVRLKHSVAQWEKTVRQPFASFEDASRLVNVMCVLYDPVGAAAQREAQAAMEVSSTTRPDAPQSLLTAAAQLNESVKQVEFCLSLLRSASSKLMVVQHYNPLVTPSVLRKSAETVELARRQWVSMQWERYASFKSKLKRKGILEATEEHSSSASSSSTTVTTTIAPTTSSVSSRTASVTVTNRSSTTNNSNTSPVERWSLLHYWRLGFDAMLHAVILRRYKDALHIVHHLNAEYNRHTEDYPVLFREGSSRDAGVLQYCTELPSRLLFLQPYLTPSQQQYPRDDCVASPLILCPGESLFPGALFLSAVELHCIIQSIRETVATEVERAANEQLLWKSLRSLYNVMNESGIPTGHKFYLRLAEDVFHVLAVASLSPSHPHASKLSSLLGRDHRAVLSDRSAWEAWSQDVAVRLSTDTTAVPHLQWSTLRSLLHLPLHLKHFASTTEASLELEVLLSARQCVVDQLTSYEKEGRLGEEVVVDTCERWVGYTLLAATALTNLGRHREAFQWFYRLAHVASRQNSQDKRLGALTLAARVIFVCVLPAFPTAPRRLVRDDELERAARATYIDCVEEHLSEGHAMRGTAPDCRALKFTAAGWEDLPDGLQQCYVDCLWWIVTHHADDSSLLASPPPQRSHTPQRHMDVGNVHQSEHQKMVSAVCAAEWFPGTYRFLCLQRTVYQQWVLCERAKQHLRSRPPTTPTAASPPLAPLALFVKSLQVESNEPSYAIAESDVVLTVRMELRGEDGITMWQNIRDGSFSQAAVAGQDASEPHPTVAVSSPPGLLIHLVCVNTFDPLRPPHLMHTSSKQSIMRRMLARSEAVTVRIPLTQCSIERSDSKGILVCRTQLSPQSVGSYTIRRVVVEGAMGEEDALLPRHWSYEPLNVENVAWDVQDIDHVPRWLFYVSPPRVPLLRLLAAVPSSSSPCVRGGTQHPRIYFSIAPPNGEQHGGTTVVRLQFPSTRKMSLVQIMASATADQEQHYCWTNAVKRSEVAGGLPVQIYRQDGTPAQRAIEQAGNGGSSVFIGALYAHSPDRISASSSSLPSSSQKEEERLAGIFSRSRVPRLTERPQSCCCTIVFPSQAKPLRQPEIHEADQKGAAAQWTDTTSETSLCFQVATSSSSSPYTISVEAPLSALRGGPAVSSGVLNHEYIEWPDITMRETSSSGVDPLTAPLSMLLSSALSTCKCSASIPVTTYRSPEVQFSSVPFSPAFTVSSVEAAYVVQQSKEVMYVTVEVTRPACAQRAVVLQGSPHFVFSILDDDGLEITSAEDSGSVGVHVVKCCTFLKKEAPWMPGEVRRYVGVVDHTVMPHTAIAADPMGTPLFHRCQRCFTLEVPYGYDVAAQSDRGTSSASDSQERGGSDHTLLSPFLFVTTPYHYTTEECALFHARYEWYVAAAAPGSSGDNANAQQPQQAPCQKVNGVTALPRHQQVHVKVLLTVPIPSLISFDESDVLTFRFQCIETLDDPSQSAVWEIVGSHSEEVVIAKSALLSPAEHDGGVVALLHYTLLPHVRATAGAVPAAIAYPSIKATLLEGRAVGEKTVEREVGVHISAYPAHLFLLPA